MINPLRILAIVPSSRCTGVAIVRFDTSLPYGRPIVEHCIQLTGSGKETDLLSRFRRLRTARQELALFLAGIPSHIPMISYKDLFHGWQEEQNLIGVSRSQFLLFGKGAWNQNRGGKP